VNAAGVANANPAEEMLASRFQTMSGVIANRGLMPCHYNASKAGVIHMSKSTAGRADHSRTPART